MNPARLIALAAACSAGMFVQTAFGGGNSPDRLWSVLDALPAGLDQGVPFARPREFKPLLLDYEAMKARLLTAPMEFTPAARAGGVELHLPKADGTFARFRVVETRTMAPELAALFPQIRSFAGFGVDEPTASVRLDVSEHGFRAMLSTGEGTTLIEPFNMGDTTNYVVFAKDGYGLMPGFRCGVESPAAGRGARAGAPASVTDGEGDNYGSDLRRIRIAFTATGEFTAATGGTVATGLSAINTITNRLTGVYEKDLATRLELVANNNLLVYTNAATDPFSAPTANTTTLTQNQTATDAAIGAANYDVGHILHRVAAGANGLAGQIGNVCVSGNKARGISVAEGSQLTGDPFTIDYVAHELGHQFAGNHTFNNCSGGSASANANSVVEPGSGVTIMGYAGICGANNIASNSIDTFHAFNLVSEMRPYLTSVAGGLCGTTIVTGNAIPSVNGGLDYTIPIGTPFVLTAVGADANGDALTYQWEQNDPRTAGVALSGSNYPDVGNNPILRSFLPSASPQRYVPRLANLFANTTSIGETLPTTTRDIDFLVAVRDGRGGYITDAVRVNSVTTAGPFVVTSDNAGATWSGNEARTVTWNVANTTAAPVNAANVSIDYTIDAGNTWTTIVSSTPNTGSATITVPNITTSSLRYRVMGVGNIFFDINNANISVTAVAQTCYANCDQSVTPPVLNAGDFTCYLSRFQAAQSLSASAQVTDYANCDGSTTPPVLNAGDFTCFLSRFRAGCP